MLRDFLFMKVNLMDGLPLMPNLKWYDENGHISYSGNISSASVYRYHNGVTVGFRMQSGGKR